MSLDPLVSHPSDRTYVLKLHREVREIDGGLCGRLENLATGHSVEFKNADELLRGLAGDIEKAGATGAEGE